MSVGNVGNFSNVVHIGDALRHATEIEQCLEDAGAEQMLLGGPMPEVLHIGGHFFADRVYVIAVDGRIERIEGTEYERTLTELLTEDADVVITVSYPIFTGSDATLYTVPKQTSPNGLDKAARTANHYTANH